MNPDFSKYVKAAAATRAIFSRFDPDFEAGSLDEAYLDITDYCREHDMTGVGWSAQLPAPGQNIFVCPGKQQVCIMEPLMTFHRSGLPVQAQGWAKR